MADEFIHISHYDLHFNSFCLNCDLPRWFGPNLFVHFFLYFCQFLIADVFSHRFKNMQYGYYLIVLDF